MKSPKFTLASRSVLLGQKFTELCGTVSERLLCCKDPILPEGPDFRPLVATLREVPPDG